MIALTLHPVAAKVAELLEPHIERQGYELVSVDFRKGTRNSLLRLLVDKPGGGIALSDSGEVESGAGAICSTCTTRSRGATRWRSRRRESTGRCASSSISRR